MEFLNRIKRVCERLTRHVGNLILMFIFSKRELDGKTAYPFHFVWDDGYLRCTRTLSAGLEWGLRFKPFPCEAFRLEQSYYTGESGFKLRITFPFILSFGFLIAPSSCNRKETIWGKTLDVTINFKEIRIVRHHVNDIDVIPTVIELYKPKRSRIDFGRWEVDVYGDRVLKNYSYRSCTTREGFPFPRTNIGHFVSVTDSVSDEDDVLHLMAAVKETTDSRELYELMVENIGFEPTTTEEADCLKHLAVAIARDTEEQGTWTGIDILRSKKWKRKL